MAGVVVATVEADQVEAEKPKDTRKQKGRHE